MAADQSACYLHELDKVHLIAVWCLSRILPNKQSAAVGQPFACAIPAHEIIWVSPPSLDEKPAQFALAAQDTVRFVVEYGWDERVLQNGIFGVEGEQPVGVSIALARSCHSRKVRAQSARRAPWSCSF